MVFNATFNNSSVISWRSVLLVEETGVPGENYRPVASHWQTLSHNVVSSALRLNGIRTDNVPPEWDYNWQCSTWMGLELTMFRLNGIRTRNAPSEWDYNSQWFAWMGLELTMLVVIVSDPDKTLPGTNLRCLVSVSTIIFELFLFLFTFIFCFHHGI